jgi:hypothetical protein
VAAQDGTIFTLDPVSLDMHALGVPSCPVSAGWPMSMTVAPSGPAYFLYSDSNLYEVDLTTLACTQTSFAGGATGSTQPQSITLGAGTSSDRLFLYGANPAPALAVSDLSSFVPFPLGAVSPAPSSPAADVTMDAWGRMFALAIDGTLLQLDPATGAVLGEDATGFDGSGGAIQVGGALALMAYGDQLYFFAGPSGSLSSYDVASKTLRPLGAVNQTVVGASAPACVGADADAGADAGAGAIPFSPGDVWIGTYVCPQGLTDLALAVDSIDGNAIHARFDFDWVDGNASGSFALDGTFDPVTREATFTAGPWVSQPGSTWETVGLDGYVDLSGTRLAGNVTHAGCGAFSVQR